MRKSLLCLLFGVALIALPLAAMAEDNPPPPPPEPPYSAITEPADGAIVTALPVTVKGIAQSNTKVNRVLLVISGSTGTTTLLCSPLSEDWSTWQYVWLSPEAGSYTLTSIAYDVYDLKEELPQSISVTINPQGPPPPDTYPPPLVVSNPPWNNYSAKERDFMIAGQTEPGTSLLINGTTAIVDENGNFQFLVTLQEGPNQFILEATDSSLNKTTLQLTINYSLSSTPTSSPTPTPTPTTPPPGGFPDLINHWAAATIVQLVEKGIISGYPDGTFRPDRPITRAEFCTILSRALKLEKVMEGAEFTDISAHWARGDILALTEKGYIKGYPDGTFGPDREIKRAEVAAIIARAKLLPPISGKPTFSDVTVDYWGFSSIEAAASQKILTGYPDGTFHPENSATRAESCVIINRALLFPGT